jgi:hypothetical protein
MMWLQVEAEAVDSPAVALQEKAAVVEVLSRTGNRAQANYSLAAKLAEKIGQQQLELMSLLTPSKAGNSGGATTQKAASSTAATGTSQHMERKQSSSYHAQDDASTSAEERLGSAGAGSGSSRSSHRSSGSIWTTPGWSASSSGSEAPWEKSIADAKERIRKAEEEAAAAGRMASWHQQESLEVCARLASFS